LTIAQWLSYHFSSESHPLSLEMDVTKEVGGMLAETIREAKKIARQEGRQEGESLGLNKGVLLVAKRMKDENLPVSTIATVTGLNEEEIRGL